MREYTSFVKKRLSFIALEDDFFIIKSMYYKIIGSIVFVIISILFVYYKREPLHEPYGISIQGKLSINEDNINIATQGNTSSGISSSIIQLFHPRIGTVSINTYSTGNSSISIIIKELQTTTVQQGGYKRLQDIITSRVGKKTNIPINQGKEALSYQQQPTWYGNRSTLSGQLKIPNYKLTNTNKYITYISQNSLFCIPTSLSLTTSYCIRKGTIVFEGQSLSKPLYGTIDGKVYIQQ